MACVNAQGMALRHRAATKTAIAVCRSVESRMASC
jgi:hypothetical protein